MDDKKDINSRVPVGHLSLVDQKYEFECPKHGLRVRGQYIEWVLEAASEMISRIEKLSIDGKVEEMSMLAEFDDTISSVDIDAAKYESRSRFETLPQCIVFMGDNDYRWVHPQARKDDGPNYLERLYDHSLTREPGGWLVDEQKN